MSIATHLKTLALNCPSLTPEKQAENDYLDALTGQPRADDVLLFALPMCAPYSAVQSYKFKAKLLPGADKTGKGKGCLHKFHAGGNLCLCCHVAQPQSRP